MTLRRQCEAPGCTREGPERFCGACGKALRAHNASGRCYLCQRAHRSAVPRRCSRCGAPLGERNRSEMCRVCFGEYTRLLLTAEKSAHPVVNVETACRKVGIGSG